MSMAEKLKGYYTPHFHFKTQFYKIFKDNWEGFKDVYPRKYAGRFGELKNYQIVTVEKFLSCSNPHNGFSYVQCTNEKCGQGYVIPFTCSQEICPSCSERQMLEFSDWLINEVLFSVKHNLILPVFQIALRLNYPKIMAKLDYVLEENKVWKEVSPRPRLNN